jgi:hypothetical protein
VTDSGRERSRDAVVRALLVVVGTTACLVYDPTAKAEEPKRALALLGVTMTLVWWLWAKQRLTCRHPAWTWAASFVGWSALATLWGRPDAVLGNWWAALGLGFLAASLGAAQARRVLQATAVLVAASTSMVALGSWMSGARGIAIHAGQGNPNWLGLVLATSLVLVLGAVLDAGHGRGARIGLWATVAVSLPALVLSESRVGWAAVLVGLAVLAVGVRARRQRVVVAMVGLVFSAGAAAQSFAGPEGSWSRRPHAAEARGRSEPSLVSDGAKSTGERPRGGSVDHTAGASLQGRLWIQRIATVTVLDKLPFGAGFGGFAPAFLQRQGAVLAHSSPIEAAHRFSNATTAHNDWIERAVESGPIGLLLLLGAFVLATRGHWHEKWPSGAAALVTTAVEALGDSPLHLPAMTVLVAFLFAALPGLGHEPTRSRWPRSAALGAAMLLGCVWLGPRAWASWFGTRIRTRADAAAPSLRLALLERSVRVDPWSGEGALELGLERLGQGDATRALADLERAESLLGDVAAAIAVGNARLELGQPEAASVAYRRALGLNPGSARARINLAEAFRRLADLERAEAEARTALTLLPGDARLRELVDAIREQRMDQNIRERGTDDESPGETTPQP